MLRAIALALLALLTPTPAQSAEAACARRMVLWAHHKTGTVMGHFATKALNRALDAGCSSSWSQASFECEPHTPHQVRRILAKTYRADGVPK